MNKPEIKLPPLSEPDQYVWYSRNLVESIRKKAIEPYAKRIAELEVDRQRRGEPVYQIRGDTFDQGRIALWLDASEDAFWIVSAEKRRILYAAPQPAEPAVKESYDMGMSVDEFEALSTARPSVPEPCMDMRHHERYIAGWNACREAMLAAPPAAEQAQQDADKVTDLPDAVQYYGAVEDIDVAMQHGGKP